MATRRTHSLEFKQSAVEASRQPGASIAGVAMAHGINANQLHKWRRQFSGELTPVAVSASSLIPVTVISDEPARSSVDERPVARGQLVVRKQPVGKERGGLERRG